MKQVGILSLQGGFEAHSRMIERLGAAPVRVRTPEDLQRIERLILPGGESTVMIRMLQRLDMLEAIRSFSRMGGALFGTCAGMILLSSGIEGMTQETLGLINMTVKRNAYGRQSESFEASLQWEMHSVPALFIRAPRVLTTGPDVECLIRYEDQPVLVKQDRSLAASFHPELGESIEVHRYFLSMS